MMLDNDVRQRAANNKEYNQEELQMTRFRSGDRISSDRVDRLSQWTERWLPALILVGVALLQFYLANTSTLSPWKGGGFGMFAAVDAPAMRVIQADGIDQDGHVLRLDMFSALDAKTARRIRALPRQSDLEHVAPQLVNQSVVPTTINRQAMYEKLLADHPDLQAIHPSNLPSFSDPPSPLNAQPLYRLKTPYDPMAPESTKTLKAVRLQWWKIHFDPTQIRLWAEPLSQVVEAGAFPLQPSFAP